MQLFPERDRRSRRLILAAALLSLLFHFVGGSLWAFLNRTIHKSGQGEQTARASSITIERLPRPTPEPTAAPQPVARVHHAPPPAHALRPETPHFSVPTYAPQPTAKSEPKPATVHRPRPQVVANVRVPPGARGSAKQSGGLTSDQIQAMEGQFRKTIDQAQQAVDTTPAPQRIVATMKEYNPLLKGSVSDIIGGDGICDPIGEGQAKGVYTYYYLTCTIKYTDGYSESVQFPWQFKFTRRDDPFAGHDGTPQRFPPQGPPADFVLPKIFSMSRAVCFYYRAECATIVAKEKANGGPG